jgi:Zn-finger nucleic acid-binding protein
MTPYRAGGPGGFRCAQCGTERAPDARACPKCGAEVPAVRCAACMTLNAIGEPACTQCGAELAPEPEASPTTLLCPRGCGPLAAFGDVFECDRCGGLFLDHGSLGELVAAHRPKVEGERHIVTMGAPPPNPRENLSPLRFAPRSSITPPPQPILEPVTYLPCPTCNVRMNRTVFGKSSGVIVDVCNAHGTWFDARELTASLAFVERGGIELVERRERERKAQQERQSKIDARTKAYELINRPAGVRGLDPDGAARSQALSDLVSVLLSL